MIDAVSGEVIAKGPDYVVVDTGGVSYRAYCPANTIRSCQEGHSALIHTHLIARDDGLHLYGFSRPEERDLFCQILTVGQVGPRLALQLLSTLPPKDFVEALAARDIARLTSVKGVGRKTAERILVELRDKVSGETLASSSTFLLSQEEETALGALTKALGFSAHEVRRALEHLRGEKLSAEELVRRALGLLGSRG